MATAHANSAAGGSDLCRGVTLRRCAASCRSSSWRPWARLRRSHLIDWPCAAAAQTFWLCATANGQKLRELEYLLKLPITPSERSAPVRTRSAPSFRGLTHPWLVHDPGASQKDRNHDCLQDRRHERHPRREGRQRCSEGAGSRCRGAYRPADADRRDRACESQRTTTGGRYSSGRLFGGGGVIAPHPDLLLDESSQCHRHRAERAGLQLVPAAQRGPWAASVHLSLPSATRYSSRRAS